MTMTDDRQERIRNRAHQIWQEEGQPAGHHERHWQQAAADIDREDAGSADKKPARKASGAGKAKAAPKEKAAAKASKPKKAAK
ncbi:DUF2934 domain-containing protein [Mesorhizobium sp. M00.F.Ca.ET.151.01.1.1]|uniref:DUF2934 domain-containing protein n=2 Tax=Mesorhizobium TaxID=68287 RepID=UPI000F7516F8|nr:MULTISPECIES: DUF2934 domain-containing protein [unclassified Mesorhizobium]AZO55451.1 DUF2934 domain-containing protein [Mesorhizobium sp. M8A.F.Ca.ET.057.01.1.1]TGR35052.1 DUF2934 domain-containing protein [Mesorhizobium sp. M8A.F.Ca.ET.202.01.1.1]TGR58664.1 DUF2934 domain-containing protein [bacterium M00.F.Ca.ET.199.01.1.1]TGR59599.1 DUF2934 domain-containing protein [Mesorhizobium sp. M8A.F.Ca.ET.198.01.1.1]TGS45855.1 DUF2934 domain-containing protein [Mesorhizobium sp. M8A.F.Ca.ET.182